MLKKRVTILFNSKDQLDELEKTVEKSVEKPSVEPEEELGTEVKANPAPLEADGQVGRAEGQVGQAVADAEGQVGQAVAGVKSTVTEKEKEFQNLVSSIPK